MQLQITTPHQKRHHLTPNERDLIQQGHDAGLSNREIARQLGVAPQTINNEIKRGTVNQVVKINGKKKYFTAYFHDAAQARYVEHRKHSHRLRKLESTVAFIDYLVHQVRHHKWSIDATVGYARAHQLFRPDEMICTTTVYNYIDVGALEIKNIDLLEKVSRRAHKHAVPKYKRILGRGIEERPETVDDRKEFGHWELDTVQGKRDGKESVILTLVERKSRMYITRLLDGKDAESVQYALGDIYREYGDVIKTVTADNGSEFATLNSLAVDAFYAHPYSASERGTNECHNRMLRRTFPKGESLDGTSRSKLAAAQNQLNRLPRKILGYETPEAVFNALVAEARA